jgi:UDP-N-acetylmuramyl pentapeptide phosphotransferase/UDP-N-acetylglucosamine-1-phosphate transferase
MDKSLLVIISSFFISLIITPIVIYYTVKKGLFVVPGRRKIHKRITPSLGGIGIFLGFLTASLFAIDLSSTPEIRYVLLLVFLIFTLGIVDDLFALSAKKKLIGQVLIVSALIVITDVRLVSFYGLFGTATLPYVASVLLTLGVMIIIINSLNLIDGLDGLAGIISIVSSFSFGSWFFLTGNFSYSLLLFALFGGIVAFIIFNWEPSKIFMGDTGSLVIGMILSVAAIKFININFESGASRYSFEGSITTAICFLSIPLIDTARIIILRTYKRQSPLRPDKNHIHHIFIKLGMSHSQSSLLLGFIHIAYVMLAVLFRDFPDIILLPGFVIFSTILCLSLDRKILKRLEIRE